MKTTQFNELNISDIQLAAQRLQGMIHRTPVLQSAQLNTWLGHTILFKCEAMQKVGAFKARGALNALLIEKEAGNEPDKVVSYSSGNHAQAVAWACQMLKIPATIFMPEGVSQLKHNATLQYGAEVILTPKRIDAQLRAAQTADEGAFLLPPFDSDAVICGQGTACLEVLEQDVKPDAIFTPCGGGGLLSGTWIAAHALRPQAQVFGVEPEIANDAARSYQSGERVEYQDAPKSIADGVNTLSLSDRTFHYIQQTQGILQCSEADICYWTQWLTHLLKVTIEPTSALGMTGAMQWLRDRDKTSTVLVILSGGNLSAKTRATVWSEDALQTIPACSTTHQ